MQGKGDDKSGAGRYPPVMTKGEALPDGLRTGVENLSGMSMQDVRVHYNSPKPADITAEDKLIETYKVPVTAAQVTVVPVEQVFQ